MQAAGLLGQRFVGNMHGQASEWRRNMPATEARQRREAELEHGGLVKDKEVEDNRGVRKRRRDRRGRQRGEEARGRRSSARGRFRGQADMQVSDGARRLRRLVQEGSNLRDGTFGFPACRPPIARGGGDAGGQRRHRRPSLTCRTRRCR